VADGATIIDKFGHGSRPRKFGHTRLIQGWFNLPEAGQLSKFILHNSYFILYRAAGELSRFVESHKYGGKQAKRTGRAL
jgi:hypothetical protein